MAEVFYRKWRPKTLAEVVGQEPVIRTLMNALTTGRVAHAYLFFGPRGTGKTSTGRLLAKAVNCLQNETGEPCNECTMCQSFNESKAIDLIEIDAASNTGVDDIRDLKEKVNFAPTVAKYKVYIIDEVHMLSTSAFNALLKTLEEPPAHVIFILATTEVHKVPATITSRCQRFDLRRIPQDAMVGRLQHICDAEAITADPEALALIAKSATGSLRDAENLLEQIVVYHGANIDLQQVRSELGLTGDARIKELLEAVFSKNIQSGLTIINNVANDGLDLRQFNREVIDALRALMLVKAGAEDVTGLTLDELKEMKMLASDVSLADISESVKLFSQADFRYSPQSTLPLELALVDYSVGELESKPEPRAEVKTPSRPKKESVKAVIQDEPSEEVVEPSAPVVPEKIPRSETSSEIEHIQQHWGNFVKACRGAVGQLDALLRGSCKPMSIEGNTLVLGFYAKSNFQKSKVEDAKYSQAISVKLEEMFGTRYDVHCITIGEENRPAPPPARENPLVKEALAHGAEIIGEEYVR